MEKELKPVQGVAQGKKPMEVIVVVQGGDVKPIMLPQGSTVENALAAAGIQLGPHRNFKIVVGGQEVKNLVTEIKDGQTIMIVGNVKGGA